MRKVVIPLVILALIGLDQWVKHWVVANIASPAMTVIISTMSWTIGSCGNAPVNAVSSA